MRLLDTPFKKVIALCNFSADDPVKRSETRGEPDRSFFRQERGSHVDTRRNQIAEQNLALAAPAAEHIALRLALNDTLPVPHPVYDRYHAALPEDLRLP